MILLFQCGVGTAAAEAYIDSVALPGDPVAPQASVLYYRDGRTVLARVGTTDRSDVPLSAVPTAVRQLILAAEDRDFYSHAGVSVRGVLRAAVADATGDRQGASTITQQYARNAFLTQDFSMDRKAREFALAVKLERQHSKAEIFERYLNTIYFGRGAYGIAAAANAYFGVPADRLTAAQGAVLAAVIKDPWHFDPAVDAPGARQRWDWIVAAAADQDWLDGRLAYPPVKEPGAGSDGPNGLIVDRVERELIGHGISAQALHTQGLAVTTTLDPVGQKAALDLVGRQLREQPSGLRAALVAVDPKTGGVRAYYGTDQGRGYFDYASALHPAASTFKPIVLAAALQQGIGYRSRWDGSSPRTFAGRGGVPLVNHDGLQCPDCTLEQAMVDSLNTPFYAVTERIGAERVRDMAVALGVPATYQGQKSMVDAKGDPKPGRTRSDIAIGRYPVTPGDLATVYATFAAGGERHDRYFVESAVAGDGTVLQKASPRGRTVLERGVASDVSTVLSSVVRGDDVMPGRPAAGKTGTQQWGNTKDNQDAWMAGYTPELATAVWFGKEKPGPIRDSAGKPIEGDTVPARLWRDFVRTTLKGKPKAPLPRPAMVGRTDVGDAGRAGPAKEPPPDLATPVIHTAGAGKRLALTFDDGPSEYTPQVLDLLREQHIKAVFCVVGESVEQHPDLVRRIVAEGHGLCNHSSHHDDLGVLDPAKAKADIEATDAALARAVPEATVTWFRAPFGSWGASATAGVQLGHTPLGWVVDPEDWTRPGTEVIVERIREQVTPRAVVLVHDGGGEREQTIEALRSLIPSLRKDGWAFDLPERRVRTHPLPTPEVAASPSPSAGVPAPRLSTPVPSETPSGDQVVESPSPRPPPSSPGKINRTRAW